MMKVGWERPGAGHVGGIKRTVHDWYQEITIMCREEDWASFSCRLRATNGGSTRLVSMKPLC
jgi:hypothetical protein